MVESVKEKSLEQQIQPEKTALIGYKCLISKYAPKKVLSINWLVFSFQGMHSGKMAGKFHFKKTSLCFNRMTVDIGLFISWWWRNHPAWLGIKSTNSWNWPQKKWGKFLQQMHPPKLKHRVYPRESHDAPGRPFWPFPTVGIGKKKYQRRVQLPFGVISATRLTIFPHLEVGYFHKKPSSL